AEKRETLLCYWSDASLERRPQRPGPETAFAAWLIERLRVIPAQDGVVEQVEPEPKAVAAQRIALRVAVVVRRTAAVHRLTLRPRHARVIEEQSVERRQRDREEPEVHATHEREAQFGVRDRDTTAEQLHRAAVD